MLAYRPDQAPWRVVLALDALVPDSAGADGLPHMVVLSLDGFAAIART